MLTKGKFRTYDRSLCEWRQSDVMFCHFRSKIRVCGNRCYTLSFKDEDKRKISVDAEKNKPQNCYLGFLNFWKFGKFWDFLNIFYFFKKIPPKFQNFSKSRNICRTRKDFKECMYQVSSNSLINAVFTALWMWKWLLFRAYARKAMHFQIFVIFRFLCNKRCSKVIFRLLDENRPINMYYNAKWPKSATWPRDLRWPWPQKRSPRAKDDAQMCQRPESCRFRLLMRLFSEFCGGKGNKWKMSNILCLTWPVTSQVTSRSNF